VDKQKYKKHRSYAEIILIALITYPWIMLFFHPFGKTENNYIFFAIGYTIILASIGMIRRRFVKDAQYYPPLESNK
jgi:hypothetical protein